MTTLHVRYFASLREALGTGETVAWPGPQPATPQALRGWLAQRGGAYAQALAPGRAVRCAVNQAVADDAATLPDGAEVAFFPPVTGG